MNLECIQNADLSKDYKSNQIPERFKGKIKTKMAFNLENSTDFWNCIEFCRFMMVTELPDEIKNYISKNANDPVLIKKLNNDYYDFFNKEINYIYYQNNNEYLTTLNEFLKLDSYELYFKKGIVIYCEPDYRGKLSSIKNFLIKNLIINGNKIKYYEDYEADLFFDHFEYLVPELKQRRIIDSDDFESSPTQEEILKLTDIKYEFYDDVRLDDLKIISKHDFEKRLEELEYLAYDIKIKNFTVETVCCCNNFVITPKSDINNSNNFLELYLYGKKLEEDGRIEELKFEKLEKECSCT